ncbi:MAG: nucleoside transporter C-terminal domain-containing protein [Planctomycetota bacterium]
MTILRAALGLAFFCAVAWALSSDRRRVNLRVVLGGIGLQLLLAVLILRTGPGRAFLDGLSKFATAVLGFGQDGARMVFGDLLTGFRHAPEAAEGAPPEAFALYPTFPAQHLEDGGSIDIVSFAFGPLATIIYFSALMAILYHLGIVQLLVRGLATLMRATLRVSGAESLAMAANVFVGQTEAPLVVRPYVPRMTRSELMALMTGGFATIAGSVLAAYIGILGDGAAGDLLAASFMSAPAAFVMAKIMVPETEEPLTAGAIQVRESELEEGEGRPTNVLDAAARGTSEGLKLYLNVVAMLIAFVAIVALINAGLELIPVGEGDPLLSLQRILGFVFYPVAWVMGVASADCLAFGSLLGTKVAVNEFIAFGDLGNMRDVLSERSFRMASFALCGFANFASIGIQLGGIGAIAEGRRGDLSRLALRAMLGGAFASWMTATIAGMFL